MGVGARMSPVPELSGGEVQGPAEQAEEWDGTAAHTYSSQDSVLLTRAREPRRVARAHVHPPVKGSGAQVLPIHCKVSREFAPSDTDLGLLPHSLAGPRLSVSLETISDPGRPPYRDDEASQNSIKCPCRGCLRGHSLALPSGQSLGPLILALPTLSSDTGLFHINISVRALHTKTEKTNAFTTSSPMDQMDLFLPENLQPMHICLQTCVPAHTHTTRHSVSNMLTHTHTLVHTLTHRRHPGSSPPIASCYVRLSFSMKTCLSLGSPWSKWLGLLLPTWSQLSSMRDLGDSAHRPRTSCL